MNRIDIINALITKNRYKSYLEVGVREGACLNNINIEYKIGVDPMGPPADYHITSDEYFEIAQIEGHTYDIIFIDGLHLYKQGIKDIKNAASILNKGGTIVVHDCNPPTEWHQRPYKEYLLEGGDWNGTIWKCIVELRHLNPNFIVNVVDVDWGCGIIKISNDFEEKYTDAPLEKCWEWDYFDEHRKVLLNLISLDVFKEEYLNA